MLVNGVQYLVTTARSSIAAKGHWCTFADVEMAVSTQPLTSSNCEILKDNEVAYFVRFTEKFGQLMEDLPEPRVVTYGMVIARSPENAKPRYSSRVWKDVPVQQKTEKKIDETELLILTADLSQEIFRACREAESVDDFIVLD